VSDFRRKVAADIRLWRYEASRWVSDELRSTAGYESFISELDAKRAWLDKLDTCGLCHGTGVRLEPVLREPMVISPDGMVKVRRFFGGENSGVIYEGWEPYDHDAPQAREVFCTH